MFALAIGILANLAVKQEKGKARKSTYASKNNNQEEETKIINEPKTQEMYRWKDEEGKWHYSNVTRKNRVMR